MKSLLCCFTARANENQTNHKVTVYQGNTIEQCTQDEDNTSENVTPVITRSEPKGRAKKKEDFQPLALIAFDEVDYLDPHAGEDCDICNSRPKTHFILPCGHSGCLPCWSKWLFSDQELVNKTTITSLEALKKLNVDFSKEQPCFVCHKPARNLKRFSLSLVELQGYEMNDNKPGASSTTKKKKSKGPRDIFELQLSLDSTLEKLVHAILSVKDELTNNVILKLKEIWEHLEALPLEELLGYEGKSDSISAILEVECLATTDVLNAYKKVFKEKRKVKSLWDGLEFALNAFKKDIEEITKVVPSLFEGAQDRKVSSATSIPSEAEGYLTKESELNALKEIQDTIKMALMKTSVEIQWEKVKELIIEGSLEGKYVPNILKVFRETSYYVNLDEATVATALTQSDLKASEMTTNLGSLLKETLPQALSVIDPILV